MSRVKSVAARARSRFVGVLALVSAIALGACQSSDKQAGPTQAQATPAQSTSAPPVPGAGFYSTGAVVAPVPAPGVPPLPKWLLAKRTATSIPFATVVLADAPATLNTAPLAKYGYVEDEYFLSGTANVYAAGGKGVVKPNVPYTTRILVRRPSDPKKFSGTIVIEPSRDVNEWTTPWLAAWPYMLKHGDIFVTFTMAKNNVPDLIKKYDPVRYSALDISDDGLRWDIMAQTAWLMRSPDGPLAKPGFLDRAKTVKGGLKLYSTGASLTGAMQSTFINNGHHARARTPEGGPVIDGYLLVVAGGMVNRPKDAAVIRVLSESEYANPGAADRPGTWATRYTDDDAPEFRFREYDVAGTSHAGWIDQSQFTVPFYQIGKIDEFAVHCTHIPSDLPGHDHVVTAALANLDIWVRTGKEAPPSALFDLKPDHTAKRDDLGNIEGGVRTYWVAAPTGRFRIDNQVSAGTGSPSTGGVCGQLGYQEPFPKDLLQRLYKTHADYVGKVSKDVDALVKARYILPSAAVEERARVAKDAVP